MSESDSYEIGAAAGKQIVSLKVFSDQQDREVLIVFTDGTELAITMEVRSVTSAVHYDPTGNVPETLARFDEPPSDASPFSATITPSRGVLE